MSRPPPPATEDQHVTAERIALKNVCAFAARLLTPARMLVTSATNHMCVPDGQPSVLEHHASRPEPHAAHLDQTGLQGARERVRVPR
jgi:hypothetical protein